MQLKYATQKQIASFETLHQNSFSSRKNKFKRQKLREELKVLRSELKSREEQTVSDILSRCQIVLCTLTMASEEGPLTQKRIKNDFDLVVIDECSQVTYEFD